MTGLAFFVVALVAPLAVVFIGWVFVRRRHQTVREWLGVAAALAAMFLVASVLAIAGWALPDALDRLPADEREAVGPALAASPGCGLLPFARVVQVEVVQAPNRRLVLRYSCGLKHLGVPPFLQRGALRRWPMEGTGTIIRREVLIFTGDAATEINLPSGRHRAWSSSRPSAFRRTASRSACNHAREAPAHGPQVVTGPKGRCAIP